MKKLKGLILHPHEVRQLAATGRVLVVRVVKPQPEFTGASGDSFEWHGGRKLVDANYGAPYVHTCKSSMVKAILRVSGFQIGTWFFVKEKYWYDGKKIFYQASDQLAISPKNWWPASWMKQDQSCFTVDTESVECKRVQEITFEQCEQTGVQMPMKKMDCDAFSLQMRHFANEWDIHNPKHPFAENCWCWFALMKKV